MHSVLVLQSKIPKILEIHLGIKKHETLNLPYNFINICGIFFWISYQWNSIFSVIVPLSNVNLWPTIFDSSCQVNFYLDHFFFSDKGKINFLIKNLNESLEVKYVLNTIKQFPFLILKFRIAIFLPLHCSKDLILKG